MRRLLPAVFVCVALALTWPLPSRIGSHLALGSEPQATVPFLNLWTIGWNAKQLSQAYPDYWDAPIFYPARGAFAYSDPQALGGALGAPFWNISPALAYNFVLLTYLTLNGYAAWRLLRRRGSAPSLAVIGGVLIQCLPFLTHERGVLQLQPLFGPIWAIGSLWDLLEEASWRHALQLAAAVAVTFFTSEYYAMVTVPALGLACLWNVRSLFSRQAGLRLGAATVLASLVILPFALSQAQKLSAMGFKRSDATLERTSAMLVDYLQPSDRLHVSQLVTATDSGSSQRLYPGAALALLAIAGLISSRRQGSQRRWFGYLLTLFLASLLLSLGPQLRLGEFSPYLSAHRLIPLLRWTRSPFRFAAFAHLALALAAVHGLRWFHGGKPRLAFALAAIMLLELVPRPESLARIPDLQPEWAENVEISDSPVIVHLPWPQERFASQFVDSTTWMLQSLAPGSRLVNGYSGFFPEMSRQLRDLLADFPSERGLDALGALGTDYVVVHGEVSRSEANQYEQWLRNGVVQNAAPVAGVLLLRLDGGPLDSIEEFEGSWRLRVETTERGPVVEAFPDLRGSDMFVYVAGSTVLDWALLVSEAGEERRLPVTPIDALLVYRDSTSWLALSTPAISQAWRELELIERDTGRVLGSIRSTEGRQP